MARHQPHLLVKLAGGGDVIPLDDETRHHLARVLRYRIGEPVTYTDGAGLIGEGVFAGDLIARGVEQRAAPHAVVTVAAAPPHNSSRLRFLVEKLAELGVDRLVWLQTEHGEGRPPKPEKAAAWARGALEQSRGRWLMTIEDPVPVAEIQEWGEPVFADPDGELVTDLGHIAKPVLCVGPEGGFGPGEIPDGAKRLRLGDTILRVETAAIVGAVLLQNRT